MITELDKIIAERDAWVNKLIAGCKRVRTIPSIPKGEENKSWTIERDRTLLHYINTKQSLSELACKYGKTLSAVRARVALLDLEHKKDNKMLDKVILSYKNSGLSTLDIAETIKEDKYKVTCRVRYLKVVGIIPEDEFPPIRNNYKK